jgi:hypothetical protein
MTNTYKKIGAKVYKQKPIRPHQLIEKLPGSGTINRLNARINVKNNY